MNKKVYVICNFNGLIETEWVLKVTGSYVQCTWGDISEMVEHRDVVTTDHYYSVIYGPSTRVDLIKPVSSVRPYIRPYTKSFFDFNEIWRVGRGRWVMHDGMQYDPIQGQGKVTSPWRSRAFESWKSCYFQKLSPPPFTMGADNWPRIQKLGHNI